jgi:hypothetical protein
VPLSPMTPPTPLAHDSFAMSYHQYTPGVRMSPRRKIHNTPGWPSTMPMDFPETIRMYNDSEEQDETVNFIMNAEFIESMAPDPQILLFIAPESVFLCLSLIARVCWDHCFSLRADNVFILRALSCHLLFLCG